MRECIVAKRLSHFERPNIESICIELSISKRKWCILFAYCISNNFSDLLDVFNLKNLFKEPPCFMSDKGSLIDIILTNKCSSFNKTQGRRKWFSQINCYRVVRSYYKKLPPKNILCRKVKKNWKTTFLRELDSRLIQGDLYNHCQEPCNSFSEVLDYHALVKQKVVRGNQAPLITKDLSKARMMKSKTKNQYVKWPSRENFLAFKKAKNKSTSINEKAKKRLFQGSCKIWRNDK